jgi:UDP-glucuronate 4-epimerase
MRILLTGCAGFIGSHLSEKLLHLGHEVTGIDNFDAFYQRSTKVQNLTNSIAHPSFTFHECDITEKDFYRSFQNSHFDAIIHLAAKAGVRPSMIDPTGYNMANIMGTTHIFEFARERKIAKVLFASSSSVYGVNKNLPWKVTDTDLQPISIYAYSKQSGEKLCELYQHYFGLNITALRFFTVFGPRQRPDLAIHKFVKSIDNDETVTLFGDGKTFRDYTYIDDIVSGVVGALHYDNNQFEIFNLGNTHTVSLMELIQTIEELLGKKAIIQYLPEQQGDVPYTWSDIQKSQELLNYNPKTGLKEGIQHFIDWYKSSK